MAGQSPIRIARDEDAFNRTTFRVLTKIMLKSRLMFQDFDDGAGHLWR